MIKILVADDSKTTRTLWVRIIQQMGLVVIQASGGAQALRILDDNPDISLLVTDIEMPNMDGTELIKRVRTHSEYENLPIIVISGVIKLADIDGLLDIGASRFLPKPLKKSDLKEYIKVLLSPDYQKMRKS